MFIDKCPCCNGTAELNIDGYCEDKYELQCDDCGCRSGTGTTLEKCVNKWNKREQKNILLDVLKELKNSGYLQELPYELRDKIKLLTKD